MSVNSKSSVTFYENRGQRCFGVVYLRACVSYAINNVRIFLTRPISDTVGIPSKSELLWGKNHIKEKLLNLELEITPVTYFRINSAAAEILCRSVAELANVDKETTLLDLFCGSGSLALTLAPVSIR